METKETYNIAVNDPIIILEENELKEERSNYNIVSIPINKSLYSQTKSLVNEFLKTEGEILHSLIITSYSEGIIKRVTPKDLYYLNWDKIAKDLKSLKKRPTKEKITYSVVWLFEIESNIEKLNQVETFLNKLGINENLQRPGDKKLNCNACHWQGAENELVLTDEIEEQPPLCPKCGSDQILINQKTINNFKNKL